MKNETARREIESLDYYLQNHTDDYSEESHTAMMMAIKALETQPCIEDYPTCTECEHYDSEKHYCPRFCQVIKDTLAEVQPCEDSIRELIREFDNKHPALFADYMREFNSHPIAEIIEYMWDMHDLIEDIKYRLPNEDGAEMSGGGEDGNNSACG